MPLAVLHSSSPILGQCGSSMKRLVLAGIFSIFWLFLLTGSNAYREQDTVEHGGSYYFNNGTHFLFSELPITPIIAYLSQPQDDVDFPTRIVNGVRISCRVAPYQAALHHKSLFVCGGSILNDEWILTAAHCVDGTKGRGFTVRVGSDQQRRGGQLRRANLVLQHARYNSKSMKNDLALLRVERPLELGSCVRPVKLPNTAQELLPDSFLVSGWGLGKETAINVQRYLRGTKVNRLSQNKCRRMYRKEGIDIYPKMLCAARRNHDSCSGDSGGPLTEKDRLYGVVSFGIGCADHRFPGVYVDVRKYIGWINDAIRRNS